MNWFKKKRLQISKSLPKTSLLILGSAPETMRQVDVPYPYRQDSNFYYLTGFLMPGSLFVLFPSGTKTKSILFIPNKNPVKESWDGNHYTTKEAKKKFLMDKVYYLSELDKKLDKYLRGRTKIFYNSINPFFNKKLRSYKKRLASASEFLQPFREIKDKTEVAHIQQAVSVTAHAHKQIALNLRPGINERTLHGIFLKSIMEKGSIREGYGSIIACGDNATTIHYIKNDSPCLSRTALLVDAGAEMNHYTADVTRVYPVNKTFSKKQKEIYNHLLQLQKQLIKEVKPGVSMRVLNQKMQEGITSILLKTKILKGTFESALKQKLSYKYCPHSLGHSLGLDVHDPISKKEKRNFTLKKGMIITIEPGIYISKKDKSAPKDLRGLGLRIEDNILVTSSGQKNLTKMIPKEVKDIEKLRSS